MPHLRFSRQTVDHGKAFQRFLNRFPEIALREDGALGRATSNAAVRVFGHVLVGDPRGRPETLPHPPYLRYSGDRVIEHGSELQAFLNRFPDIELNTDGKLGRRTSNAVKRVLGHALNGDPRGVPAE